jgi:DNA-directed RNA polymerase subunit beta
MRPNVYEDGIEISERCVSILTTYSLNSNKIIVKLNKYGGEFVTKSHLLDLDDDLFDLDEEGIIKVGSKVTGGSLLIAKKTMQPDKNRTVEGNIISSLFSSDKVKNFVDSSFRLPKDFREGFIHEVIVIKDKEIKKMIKIDPSSYTRNDLQVIIIKIAQKRKLEVGDKLTTRFGNKGVITKIVPECDMPFDEEGNRIDIIFNPLGIPTRMNIGQLFEALLGKAFKKINKYLLCKPFNTVSFRDMEDILEEANIKDRGLTKLYDGITGDPYPNKIFCGNIYVLKLNHMSADKFHVRDVGALSILNQQPTKGRKLIGGQKIGTMEA